MTACTEALHQSSTLLGYQLVKRRFNNTKSADPNEVAFPNKFTVEYYLVTIRMDRFTVEHMLMLLVNNPTCMYLSDLRVYFKLEVYVRVT